MRLSATSGGYPDDEFRAFGLGVPSPRDKVDGLAEAIEITHGLWSRRGFTYDTATEVIPGVRAAVEGAPAP